MDGLNESLGQIALKAQMYTLGTKERQRHINQLIRMIEKSGRLCRPLCPSHLQGSYNEIYATAKQRLFLYLYQKIELYNPSRGGLLEWVNWLLKTRFPDAIREFTEVCKGIDLTQVKIRSVEELDQVPDTQSSSCSNPLPSQQVLQYVRDDSDGVFSRTYTSGNPQANFRYIFLRLCEGYKWKEISQELNVPVPNLSNFYQRHIKKFAPKFRDDLSL
ncbi:MAG: sigma-70 family RNA polymerase sigma factor [Cyanobacteria bacterium J06592_8]